ncbi:MAG TPA: hypothetical protein VMC62_12615 [Longilinea sp.]|nr:hypothetical protein [Longilinea sp.]
MTIHLLDNSLKIDIFYETRDKEFEDNICVRIMEDCPDDERLFRAEETNIFLNAKEACQLAEALRAAAKCSLETKDE